MPLQSIAHYELTEKIGEGGMGEVYRATDTKLKRPVAIKLLPEAVTKDTQRMARFEREAQLFTSQDCNHRTILPNLVLALAVAAGLLTLMAAVAT